MLLNISNNLWTKYVCLLQKRENEMTLLIQISNYVLYYNRNKLGVKKKLKKFYNLTDYDSTHTCNRSLNQGT